MLTWLVKEVVSPYGDVATLHWAVPDADDGSDGAGVDDRDDDKAHKALQVALESAEDQLGAVLWNSNSAALRHLHTHILQLPTPSQNTAAPTAAASAPLTGTNVVELGAGVGCLGIALAMAGAHVAITDLKELLPLMKHNANLNDARVQARSGGVGRCVALQWKWGPTASTSVHKQVQKAKITESSAQVKSGNNRTAAAPSVSSTSATSSSSSSGGGSGTAAAIEDVVSTMVESLLKPSASLLECAAALTNPGASSSRSAAAESRLPFHYVVLCDALYGNPKDWPALLYTLTELLATNPGGCEIVNFCEQRVNDVEGAFLRLLDDENAKRFVPFRSPNRRDDDLWAAVVRAATGCCTSLPTAASAAAELHARREEAASALLHYVLVQRREHYAWSYETQVVQEAQSELDMTIRVTRIRWVRQESRAKAEDGEAHPASVQSRHRRRPRDAAGDDGSAAAAHAGTKKMRQQQ